MKKLKLNLQQLNNVEVLTRNQLKNVLGGVVAPTTSVPCCIRAVIAGTNIEVIFDPIQVSGQAACASAADTKVTSGQYSTAHYDTNCDEQQNYVD